MEACMEACMEAYADIAIGHPQLAAHLTAGLYMQYRAVAHCLAHATAALAS